MQFLQDLSIGAVPEFSSVKLTSLTASRIVQTDASKVLASVTDLTNFVDGTANQITSTSDGSGGVTLSLPSNIITPGDLRVGSGTEVFMTMNGDDALFSGDIETLGNARFTGIPIFHSAQINYNYLSVITYYQYNRATVGYYSAVMGLRDDATRVYSYVLSTSNWYSQAHDLPDLTTPSLAFFGLSPNVSNNCYGRIHHNGTDVRFISGPNTGVGTGAVTVNNGFIFAPWGSDKVMITPLGGLAVKLTNETGANTEKGRLVKTDTATDDAVIYTGIDDTECIGVFYEDGTADGAEAWVVIYGPAEVAFDDNVASARGDWVETSEAGYANSQASPAAAPAHFQEIGHCMQTVSATGGGTHILARCMLHFN